MAVDYDEVEIQKRIDASVSDEELSGKMGAASKAASPGPDYKRNSSPTAFSSGMSQALMQSAFTKFGEALTDTGDVKKDAATRESRLAPFMEAGSQVAGALQDRWWKMEYENFQAEFVESFVAQKKELFEEYSRRSTGLDEGWAEGPDGNPIQIPINSKEGRLQAVRMRGQLESKFGRMNTDMDLALFNEAGKFSSNPFIVERANSIMTAGASAIATQANPQGSRNSENTMSQIRGRENEAEIGAERNKLMREKAARDKPTRSMAEALAQPNSGAEGTMGWLTSDPNGYQLLETAGAKYLNAEKQAALGHLMSENPDMDPESTEMLQMLKGMQPQYVRYAATKFLKEHDPQAYQDAKKTAPHWFATDEEENDRGVVSADRQDPAVRRKNVATWQTHAQTHVKEFMKDPGNEATLEAVMADLEEWLGKAVFGDTDEPLLQAVTATRGEGNKKYVADVLDQVPEAIRNWWWKEGGNELLQELDPAALKHAKTRSGKSVHGYGLDIAGGRAAGKKARIIRRSEGAKKRKQEGIVADLKIKGLL